MLSKKTKYAIRALIALGERYQKESVNISFIAETEKIPKKFLEQILLELRNAGFLYSKKGAGGGYSLLKDPQEINLVQVMRLTGGPIAQLPCVSLNFYQRCDECKEESTCGIRDTFKDVRDATLKILSETTIADLIAKEKRLAG
ncbi:MULTISPECIES: RrF2 family transcriptional regulator [Pedobacter]|uniref:Rrf2 family transcriptional regulator n=2 Tax=Pedobacter TaxID=84567 RepID=A0A7K0FQI2_9SPHI|nr:MULTISPECIES: Rrf2 family transcriptional regulator [Pedobacter]KHJ39771.1 HTH-type transcriptional regulator CymR [Pedobacter glucosidilyticus]MRX48229.1 Rrf2 family transcriptional regulator [Pedobacter puniceum]QEK51769.1 Rrf2 family transcriptional regulator [Pedobacter aquae]